MSIALLRALVLLPVVGVAFVWWLRPPRGREAAARLGALVWVALGVMAVNQIALDRGAWGYEAEGGMILGVPGDVWMGWVALWGGVPLLVWPGRLPLIGMTVAALWIDLVIMPHLDPLVHLGDHWVAWDLCALAVAALPAWGYAQWTRGDRHRGARAVLQGAAYLATTLWLIPTAILGPIALPERGIGIVLFFVAMFAAAIHEFVRVGRGTPIPLDPPTVLVTTGPYAYVRNPMQVAALALWLVWGALLGSPVIAAGALVTWVYGTTFARWHEAETLPDRWPGYSAWADAVPMWWPRWRPHVAVDATLWVARGCDPCSALADWVAAREPWGLVLRDAADHPEALTRLRWERPDTPPEVGVAALARALEQVHLGWGIIGWIVRLPGVVHLVQLWVDASGGGPRRIPRRKT